MKDIREAISGIGKVVDERKKIIYGNGKNSEKKDNQLPADCHNDKPPRDWAQYLGLWNKHDESYTATESDYGEADEVMIVESTEQEEHERQDSIKSEEAIPKKLWGEFMDMGDYKRHNPSEKVKCKPDEALDQILARRIRKLGGYNYNDASSNSAIANQPVQPKLIKSPRNSQDSSSDPNNLLPIANSEIQALEDHKEAALPSKENSALLAGGASNDDILPLEDCAGKDSKNPGGLANNLTTIATFIFALFFDVASVFVIGFFYKYEIGLVVGLSLLGMASASTIYVIYILRKDNESLETLESMLSGLPIIGRQIRGVEEGSKFSVSALSANSVYQEIPAPNCLATRENTASLIQGFYKEEEAEFCSEDPSLISVNYRVGHT